MMRNQLFLIVFLIVSRFCETTDFDQFTVVRYERLPCREAYRKESYCLQFIAGENVTKCIEIERDIWEEEVDTPTSSVIVEKEYNQDYEAYRFTIHLFSGLDCTLSLNESFRIFETNCFEMDQKTQKYPGLRIFRECLGQTDAEIYVDFITFMRERFMVAPLFLIVCCCCGCAFTHCFLVALYLYCNHRVTYFAKNVFFNSLEMAYGNKKKGSSDTKQTGKDDTGDSPGSKSEDDISDEKVEMELKDLEEGGGEMEPSSSSSSSSVESKFETETETHKNDKTPAKLEKGDEGYRPFMKEPKHDLSLYPKHVIAISISLFLLLICLISPALFVVGIGSVCGLSLFSPCWDCVGMVSRPMIHSMYIRRGFKDWWLRYAVPLLTKPCCWYFTKGKNVIKSVILISVWSLRNSSELLVAVLSVAKLKEEINDPKHLEVWMWNKNVQLTYQMVLVLIVFSYGALICMSVSFRLTSTYQTAVFISAFKEYFYFRLFQLLVNTLGIAMALYVTFYQETFRYYPGTDVYEYTIRVAGLVVPILLLVRANVIILIWEGVGGSALMMQYKKLRPSESMLIPEPIIPLKLCFQRDPDEITQFVIVSLSLLSDEKLGYEVEKNDHVRRKEKKMGQKEYAVKYVFPEHQSYLYLFWQTLTHLKEYELEFLREFVAGNRVLDVGNYLLYRRYMKKKRKEKMMMKGTTKTFEEEEDDDENDMKVYWMVDEREIFSESALAYTTAKFCFRTPMKPAHIKQFCCFFCLPHFERVDRDTRVARRVMRYNMEEGRNWRHILDKSAEEKERQKRKENMEKKVDDDEEEEKERPDDTLDSSSSSNGVDGEESSGIFDDSEDESVD